MPFAISAGNPAPLGATVLPDGVNFSLFSQNATKVQLLLFDAPDAAAAAQVIEITEPTRFYWHVKVEGLAANATYAYRVFGTLRAYGYATVRVPLQRQQGPDRSLRTRKCRLRLGGHSG